MQKSGVLSLLSSPFIWRGSSVASDIEVERSGFAALDQLLPGGGWPRGAVTELLHSEEGLGELSLLMPTLVRLSRRARIAFVAPPHMPYAPALAQAGINLSKLAVLQPTTDTEAWWCAEQLLRSGQFRAVLFWPDRFDERALRRLQAASEAGSGCGFVFHESEWAQHASPAPLRVRIDATTSATQIKLAILKRRGSLISTPITLDVREAIARAIHEASDLKQRALSKMGKASKLSREPAITAMQNLQQRKSRSRVRWPHLMPAADTLALSTVPDR